MEYISNREVKTMAQQPDKTTSMLFSRLLKTADLNSFMEKNADIMHTPLFHEYISGLCSVLGEKQESVIKRSSIERTYGHQLFNGTRKPSRDKAIQLAFGLRLNLEDTQQLLKIAQKSQLYPKIKRDAVIIYCINRKIGIIETQTMLHELELTAAGRRMTDG